MAESAPDLGALIKAECQALRQESFETEERIKKRAKQQPVKFVERKREYVKSEEVVQVVDEQANTKFI